MMFNVADFLLIWEICEETSNREAQHERFVDGNGHEQGSKNRITGMKK